ncbi:MAG: glutamine--fructose-6-phosphate transaminase (isomerizing) [Actinobacteria bacterium]|nr:glutamine--fructose-6-phosphate transaminase (isomerizing) [Actinomycetota bacterium]MCG2819665.1 glutamine--fructose-6-phosphate transaminase (isomerizing) [Actinomycetes bacterium]MBU4179222.1 glutamine--fructose-6-phosphate transaminase (isomerizing) [Actinomycetota bacterium]MBU4217369.1 glutamine--fructose-6-phosphate transaminase (isomerizing) [Actinomycetota bacterium]MBU4359931.1 glutamine--fructose-6-phosphate transaminase (isomerizing) [Actinomycetota bacterium]
MCGITGYLGNRQAKEVLFSGLRRLEYRGYDSAGICVVSPTEEMGCVRVVGNLDVMEDALESAELPGTIGIGHTRWATHGAPTVENAHPHLDCDGKIAVVHNGIIENFVELKHRLQSGGHRFRSQTDSETIAHLIEEQYRGDLAEALRRSLDQLEGAYAIVAVHRDEPDVIVAARRDSPLVLGTGDGEHFLASAIPAYLDMTKRFVFLEDNELLAINRDGYTITGPDGPVSPRPVEVDWDIDAAEKGGYEDFMLKEIYEQPRAVEDTLADKFDSSGEIEVEELCLDPEGARALRRIVVVACGTSFHAGLLAKYLFERWASLPVEIEIASEFRYRNLVVTEDDLVVAVSQSGETMDTLAGVREARRRGARVIAVVNVVGSQMTREADGVIYTHAGPEVGVAATKTFTTQMAAMYVLAMYLGRLRGEVTDEKYRMIVSELQALPRKMEEVLAERDAVIACAEKYQHCHDFLFMGRSVGYPIAMEGALKLKEISYLHAEGYPAGEMKHGPIALLDKDVPVVAITPRNSVYDKMISNIQETKARGAPVVAVATRGDPEIEEICDDVLWVPETTEMLYPVLTVIPLQLLAYQVAKLRGCNVDQPRNLAKTVTVE